MPARRKPSPEAQPAGKKTASAKTSANVTGSSPALVTDLRQIILSAREQVARAVDSGLVLLYWSIGHRIRTDVLDGKRAAYGKEIVSAVGRQLAEEFGDGFSHKNLRHMIRFAEVFPDLLILQSLIAKLSWTHFKSIIYIDDSIKRDFYAEMCRIENWNTRTLRGKIDSMLFERTALSKKPAKLAEMELAKLRTEDRMTPDLVFRDPYVLDFLGLKDTYAERDLETAILREIESFILELGTGFAFIARQKRMTIDNEDHYLDLLFYHRHLRRMVAIREYMMRNEQGLAPTHAAFQKFFNLTPPSVNSMLIRLEQRGFIRRTPGQARGIQLIIAPDLIPPLERPFKF